MDLCEARVTNVQLIVKKGGMDTFSQEVMSDWFLMLLLHRFVDPMAMYLHLL